MIGISHYERPQRLVIAKAIVPIWYARLAVSRNLSAVVVRIAMSGLLSEVLNAESQSQRLNLWDTFRVNCGEVCSYAQRWA